MTWNLRRATESSLAWEYFLELDPDVALLQEVGRFPDCVQDGWNMISRLAIGKTGREQRFQTALLIRGSRLDAVQPLNDQAWVQSELDHFNGNLIAGQTSRRSQLSTFVSVYSPAWPVNRERLAGVDTTGVKLTYHPDVFLADVLLASLPCWTDDAWIVGGDFNLSETFDIGRPWAGNGEFLQRMTDRGFTDCLRATTGRLTPTFRSPRGGGVIHQMDHLFVSMSVAADLVDCSTGSVERVFGDGLSDHLPIIADFTS